ncbi:MAG: VCBS repeat-containing protein [Bacteroidota bacterium]
MKITYLLLITWSLLGLACQTAWEMHIIDDTSSGADGAKCYDVDQDGTLEIVVGWEQGNVVRMYQQLGAGQWDWLELPAPEVEDVLVADLDGDGFPEVVSLSEGNTQRISIHWAPDSWDQYWQQEHWLSQDVPVSVGRTRWMFGRAAQIDGKHGLDLVVGSKDPNGTFGWLQAPANPREMAAWQYHEICPAGWIMSIEVLDLNGDDAPDLLFTDRKGPHRGLKQAIHPGFETIGDTTWLIESLGMEAQEPMFLGLYSSEEDALSEIWVADHDLGLFGFGRKTDSSQWAMLHELSFPHQAGRIGKSVALGDLDGDQRPEIVSSYEGALGRRGVVGTQHPQFFTQPDIFPISGKAGLKYDFIRLVDLDADGDLDVLTCEEANNGQAGKGLGVIWYKNPR